MVNFNSYLYMNPKIVLKLIEKYIEVIEILEDLQQDEQGLNQDEIIQLKEEIERIFVKHQIFGYIQGLLNF